MNIRGEVIEMARQHKWTRVFFVDLGERVAASALGGVLTMLALTWTDLLASSTEAWWTVVGVPAATSLVKGLLANLPGPEPSASAVDVSSYGADVPVV
jgi:hypothetical protein